MDFTPIRKELSQNSSCPSSSLAKSNSLFESTPKETTITSSTQTSRKRKLTQFESTVTRRLADIIDECPFTPPASSTLNESLINNLEKCNLAEELQNSKTDLRPAKFIKHNSDSSIHSAPSTPVKQTCTYSEKKSSSVSYSGCKVLPYIAESPLNEKHDILYPNLKPVGGRRTLTPRKSRTPPKRYLFEDEDSNKAVKLLQKITTIDGIMGNIFKYLSNGDLYRFTRVSSSFKLSVLNNTVASKKFYTFLEQHKVNKENYQITPPSSPEKDDTPPVSPESRHFYKFTQIAKSLETDQSLMKCLQCSSPAIVMNMIAQCTNSICGYIYCKNCGSNSKTGPSNFIDKCGKATLQCLSKQELTDRSNIWNYDTSISIFSSPKSESQSISNINISSSGYYSCSESESTRSLSVKRNLSSSFSCAVNNSDRVLSQKNTMSPKRNKAKRKSLLTPACKVRSVGSLNEEQLQIWDPPSPVRAQDFSICSRKSKRNLKRLTR